MTSVLLHGFWGQPSDWNKVLAELPLGASVLTPDLFEPGPLAPSTTLEDWPAKFWHWVEHEVGDEKIQLVGYSMGARLALNALMRQSHRVHRALLLSGRPVMNDGEKPARIEWERNFAEQFLSQPWSELEKKWQGQAVFSGTQTQERRRSDLLREMLAFAMTEWSPTKHPFGPQVLRELPMTVDWAFGARDEKYVGVAEELRGLGVKGQVTVLENAGHRIPFDRPDFIARWITE